VPFCNDDADCGPGEICENNQCVRGCRDDQDCQQFDPGMICEDNQCVRGCRDSSQCPPGTYCDNLVCVPGCETDADCQAGEACINNECVRGCQSDADCDLGFICEGNTCVEGCRDDRDCQPGMYCEQGQCEAGCTTDDDCPWGMHCWVAQHECVECVTDDHCWDPLGQSFCDLQTHTCREGCTDNGDCGRDQVCDTTQDPAVCVECYAGDTSVCDNWGLVCDTTSYFCVECLQDSDCQDSLLPYCQTDFYMCVECYEDQHCAADEVCDTQRYVCRSSTGRGLCEPCTDDSECGVAADMCVDFRDANGGVIDQGCGRACGTAGTPCPAGYRCAQLGANTMQCVPNNTEDNPTCAGIRDMGQPCNFGSDECGIVDVPDGTCVPSMGGGYCSVQCAIGAPGDPPTCIDPWACTSLGGFFEVCTIQ
jgi:hypothetical protein